MKFFRTVFLLSCIVWGLLSASTGSAGNPIPVRGSAQPLGIAYYDADHLYDTVPSPFYDDSDYTPGGRYGWNTARYMRKVRHVAAVIDSMSLPIVALWSVENEAVVRDIAAACVGDYVYLHRTLNSLDGMDFALLYHGDVFYPGYIESGRRYLYVEGVVRRMEGPGRFAQRRSATPRVRVDTLGLVLCSDTRMVKWVVEELRDDRPGVKLLVLGRSQLFEPAEAGLVDAHARAAARGRGNIRIRTGWRMRDRILADTALRTTGGDVFARRFLVDHNTTYPIKTFENGRYRGGYSYALPVYVYIE